MRNSCIWCLTLNLRNEAELRLTSAAYLPYHTLNFCCTRTQCVWRHSPRVYPTQRSNRWVNQSTGAKYAITILSMHLRACAPIDSCVQGIVHNKPLRLRSCSHQGNPPLEMVHMLQSFPLSLCNIWSWISSVQKLKITMRSLCCDISLSIIFKNIVFIMTSNIEVGTYSI